MTVVPDALPLSAVLIVTGGLLVAISGLPALFIARGSGMGQRLAATLTCLGGGLGLTGAINITLKGATVSFTCAWGLPFGSCTLAADPVSALFLIPVFLIAACCAIYFVRYWPAEENPDTVRKLTSFFGLLAAAMVLLILARNMVLFLLGWEIMALSAYFVLAAETDREEVREAGFVYLIATHTGTLALFAMFALVYRMHGSFEFPSAGTLAGNLPEAGWIIVAALVGFGMKAGLVPLHVWLPGAHANAPSHVSAMMSGVVIKMGLYGLVRVLSFFHAPPVWWGGVILAAGIVTAIMGIVQAIGQEDMKRLLAYSSIENVGIVTMGVGTAMIGRAGGNTSLFALGMAGSLLHLLNHSLFKPLLFFTAGGIIHATGTRRIDSLGGLARRMPYSAILLLTGAVAISGLPPLNGFAGEFLLYLGFFTGISGNGTAGPLLSAGAAGLAFTGGLAALCFIRLYSTIFLGLPRGTVSGPQHEMPGLMLMPAFFLGFLCLAVGIFPGGIVHLLRHPVACLLPESTRQDLLLITPTGWITIIWGLFFITLLLCGLLLYRRIISQPAAIRPTWDCGYALPSRRMQYTASSFSESLVGMFRVVLRPREHLPAVSEHFPTHQAYSSSLPETALDLVIFPGSRLAGRWLSFLRKIQHGEYQLYILYIFVTLIALLIWAR